MVPVRRFSDVTTLSPGRHRPDSMSSTGTQGCHAIAYRRRQGSPSEESAA